MQPTVWLDAMRTAMSHLQRPWRFWSRMRCRMLPPSWMSAHDPLRAIYEVQDLLLRHGRVTWTALVQANNLLFEPGDNDHPALIVRSAEVTLDVPVDQLQQVAQRLYRLKHTEPADAAERQLARMITNEMDRAQDWRVPPALCGGVDLAASACMLFRGALPDARLRRGLLPMLMHPDTESVLPVPLHCWPVELVDWWQAGR